MHLAILMTNTDESAFSDLHPRDGVKFTDLIQLVRPDWTTKVFAVKDGVFPDDLSQFDGVMITGSPASARGDAPWVARLLDLIRQMNTDGMPMFGACFGHQAIALALGGNMGPNPGGWVHGLTHNIMVHRPDWARDLPDTVRLYASHCEQVTQLPKGAQLLSQSEDCAISGFALNGQVYTTQHHPEMTADFIAALTDEVADEIGPKLAARARTALAERSDMAAFSTSIARFFEQAARQSRTSTNE